MSSNLVKFGFLPARQCAFLLCDLQEKFRPVLLHFQEIVQSAARLAKVSEVLNIPLIVTEQNPKSLGSTVTEIQKDHAKGTFGKSKFSMCIPEVVEELNKIPDLSCIVLFGIETHACIEQTAVELKGKGLDVHVVADACTSRSLEDRLLALERMKQMGCFIATTENVIFKLLADASHPKFSQLRPLVKNVTPYTGPRNGGKLDEKATKRFGKTNPMKEQDAGGTLILVLNKLRPHCSFNPTTLINRYVENKKEAVEINWYIMSYTELEHGYQGLKSSCSAIYISLDLDSHHQHTSVSS